MRVSTRRGVSLPEVLVASVLLAVGVAGCLSALATALRLRTAAWEREALAATAQDRLTWFAARGCSAGDTTFAPQTSPRLTEHWRVAQGAGAAELFGVLRGNGAGFAFDFRIRSRVACD